MEDGFCGGREGCSTSGGAQRGRVINPSSRVISGSCSKQKAIKSEQTAGPGGHKAAKPSHLRDGTPCGLYSQAMPDWRCQQRLAERALAGKAKAPHQRLRGLLSTANVVWRVDELLSQVTRWVAALYIACQTASGARHRRPATSAVLAHPATQCRVCSPFQLSSLLSTLRRSLQGASGARRGLPSHLPDPLAVPRPACSLGSSLEAPPQARTLPKCCGAVPGAQ